MIYLLLNRVSEDKATVRLRHDLPFDPIYGLGKTRQELEIDGVLVDSVPNPEINTGMSSELYVNPKTNELWYEYTPQDKTEVELLQEENVQLKNSLADVWEIVLLGGV